MTQPQDAPRSLEETLADALKTAKEFELRSENADAVRLALQALLLMRGALDPQLFTRNKKFNPYPVFVKYIRASNAETLGGLANEVIQVISPQVVTLHSLGEAAEALYRVPSELNAEALQLLREETTPLVILMKKIYQDARGGFDEAFSGDTDEEAIEHDESEPSPC